MGGSYPESRHYWLWFELDNRLGIVLDLRMNGGPFPTLVE
jgi:hypothetical protein